MAHLTDVRVNCGKNIMDVTMTFDSPFSGRLGFTLSFLKAYIGATFGKVQHFITTMSLSLKL